MNQKKSILKKLEDIFRKIYSPFENLFDYTIIFVDAWAITLVVFMLFFGPVLVENAIKNDFIKTIIHYYKQIYLWIYSLFSFGILLRYMETKTNNLKTKKSGKRTFTVPLAITLSGVMPLFFIVSNFAEKSKAESIGIILSFTLIVYIVNYLLYLQRIIRKKHLDTNG